MKPSIQRWIRRTIQGSLAAVMYLLMMMLLLLLHKKREPIIDEMINGLPSWFEKTKKKKQLTNKLKLLHRKKISTEI